jgi:AbiV family abortive infection protein
VPARRGWTRAPLRSLSPVLAAPAGGAMNGLSAAEVEGARRKVLRNAVALLREARLLFRNRRYPRAYALAHLASEEMSKLPMLVRAGLESQADPRFDWRKLGKRLQSHKSKLRAAVLWDYMLDPDMADDADLKRLQQGLEDIDEANVLKNRSLYAGVVGESFVSPRESVSAETAAAMIDRSLRRLSAYLTAEATTRGAVLKSTPEQLRRVEQLVRRFQKN